MDEVIECLVDMLEDLKLEENYFYSPELQTDDERERYEELCKKEDAIETAIEVIKNIDNLRKYIDKAYKGLDKVKEIIG